MTDENMRKKIAIAAAHSYDDWVEEDYAKRIQKIDFDKLADALIATGVQILPCKVGDIVYTVSFGFADGYDKNGKWYNTSTVGIYETKIDEKNIYRMCDSISIGWTFLTREEAEAWKSAIENSMMSFASAE